MDFVSLLGSAGTVLGLIRAVPQLIRLIRAREAYGVSLDTAATSSIVSFGWATYGLLSEQPYVVFATGSSGLIFAIITFLAIRFGRSVKEFKVAPLWILVLFLAGLLFGKNGLGVMLPISVLAANIPQLWVAYKERNLRDLSLGTWLLSISDGLVWGLYALMQHDVSIMVYGLFQLITSGPIVLLKILHLASEKELSSDVLSEEVTSLKKSQTNQLLGYPLDARLLIINADDFGMCHSVNEAVMRAFEAGVLCSTTLMVPCPWALHAMHFLSEHPAIPFGIHLTVLSEWADYRWGPITPKEKVPSLIEPTGYFYNFDQMPEFLAHVNLKELELEFRSQIETTLGAGLKPTHLDWHALRIGGRDDIVDLMLKLAKEYRLALRVREKPSIEKVQRQNLPCNDYDFLDSYLLDSANKSAQYRQLLRELPEGLSEWAIHPALDSAELLAIEHADNHIRQTDFDLLISSEAKEIIKEEGIILLNYRALQDVWNKR